MNPFEEIASSVVKRAPEFREVLAGSVDTWLRDDGTLSAAAIASELGRFILRLVQEEQSNATSLTALFAVIEELVVNGSPPTRDAISTCCLETLLNLSTSSESLAWTGYLGKGSREFCRSWDTFTGVRTPGLWQSDE